MKVLSALTALIFSFSHFPSAQQASPPGPSSSSQATTLLTQSVAALMGQAALSDVILSGSARRLAGSDDETGSGVLMAITDGASRMDLSLPSGTWNEILSTSLAQPSGSWTGPDGLTHQMAFHNLLVGSSWFFPVFPIARGLSAAGYVATYVGPEIHNGQAVVHVSVSQVSTAYIPQTVVALQQLSKLDVFLDSLTLLPAAVSFNMHPDNDALVDIPIEVRFSDYRSVKSSQVSFHIQKYMNGSLILDFQAQSATLNSGLSPSQFTVQ